MVVVVVLEKGIAGMVYFGSMISAGVLPVSSPWPSFKPTKSSKTRVRSNQVPLVPLLVYTMVMVVLMLLAMSATICSVIFEVSRSIGDVYMKHAKYNGEQINAKFRLPEPMNNPILTANPAIVSLSLQPNDSFLIFASDGLWEHLSNEQAVDIVHNHPRAGSAKRLIKAALHEAARKREMRYSDLRRIDKKVRRHFHDDITVIVLFLKQDLISRSISQDHQLSIRSALEH